MLQHSHVPDSTENLDSGGGITNTPKMYLLLALSHCHPHLKTPFSWPSICILPFLNPSSTSSQREISKDKSEYINVLFKILQWPSQLILELNPSSWLGPIRPKRHGSWLHFWPRVLGLSHLAHYALATLAFLFKCAKPVFAWLWRLYIWEESLLPDLDMADSSSYRSQSLSSSPDLTWPHTQPYFLTLFHLSHFHFLHSSMQLVIFLFMPCLLPSLDFLSSSQLCPFICSSIWYILDDQHTFLNE